MKFTLPVGLLLGGILIFSGCDKKEDTPSPSTTTTQTDTTTTNPVATTIFKAKIDNTDWKPVSQNTSISSGMFGLYGTSKDSVTLKLLLNTEITRTGKYTSGSMSVEVQNPDNSFTTQTAYLSDSLQNEFNITKYDSVAKKISGTFHFKTTYPQSLPPKNVTEGIFTDIKLP